MRLFTRFLFLALALQLRFRVASRLLLRLACQALGFLPRQAFALEFRFEFRLHDHETDELVTSPEWVTEILRDHVPDPTSLEFIRWRVYTHHGRVAGSFRVGRQMVAGDAAHLMPVWLGQGWNSGVRDAMNLGWKLMIPTALGWFMLLAAFRIGRDQRWDLWLVGGVSLAVIVAGAALLQHASRVSARNREHEGAMF